MNSRILPVFALMIAVGAFFAYVQPNWSGNIATLKAGIKTDVDALAAADKYKKSQNTLATARNAIDPANLDRLAAFLPDSVDNVRLILDINALAARSGLSLSNIDAKKNESGSSSGATTGSKATVSAGGAAAPVAGAPTTGAAVAGATTPLSSASGSTARSANLTGSVDLTLTAVGTYSAFKTFLTSLEKSARLLDVSEVTVKSADTGVYTYQMTIKLYWLK